MSRDIFGCATGNRGALLASRGSSRGLAVVKTLHFQCKGCGFDPWLGNWDPICYVVQSKNEINLEGDIEARDAAKHPTMHRAGCTIKNFVNQNVNSAMVEKLGLTEFSSRILHSWQIDKWKHKDLGAEKCLYFQLNNSFDYQSELPRVYLPTKGKIWFSLFDISQI